MLASRATFNQVGSMAFQKAPSKNLTPERLVAELHQLPPVARVLARLQRLLANPESGINDVASLIRLDAALATNHSDQQQRLVRPRRVLPDDRGCRQPRGFS